MIRYRLAARALHWLMAVLVLLTIPAGFVMVQPGLDRALQNALFVFHKNIGVVLLLLVAWRLIVRATNPPPPLPAGIPAWQVRIAGASHALLYALLVVLPVAGYVRVRAGGFPVEALDALGAPTLVPRSDALAAAAKAIHAGAGLALAALIALHVAAALQHALLRRDGVFARMWPPVGR